AIGGVSVLSVVGLTAPVSVGACGAEARRGGDCKDERGGGERAADWWAEHESLPPGIGKHRPAKQQVSLVASIFDQLAGGSSHLDCPLWQAPCQPDAEHGARGFTSVPNEFGLRSQRRSATGGCRDWPAH